MKLKNINTEEEKSILVKFKKEVLYIGSNNCPKYTFVMCGNFPVIQEIKRVQVKIFDCEYIDEQLLIFTDNEIREINLSITDDNIKNYFINNNKIYLTSYYSLFSFSESLVMETITLN